MKVFELDEYICYTVKEGFVTYPALTAVVEIRERAIQFNGTKWKK